MGSRAVRNSKKQKPHKRFIRWCLWLGIRLLLTAVILTVLQVSILRFLNPPFTVAMAWNWVQEKFKGGSDPGSVFFWRDLEDISPHLRRAVLAGEDQRFPTHHGFDFVELSAAIRDGIFSDRVRGASTISMQTARTLFLWPDRSLARKALEAYYTFLIELVWGKKRILEMYLNTVDWGEGILGAEAACRRYFRTRSNRLSPSQAALLAAVLPNPHKWSPANPTPYLEERQRRILEDMRKMPLI
jgi:monofunctional biosynthetic peptidoglycan transglycosylase